MKQADNSQILKADMKSRSGFPARCFKIHINIGLLKIPHLCKTFQKVPFPTGTHVSQQVVQQQQWLSSQDHSLHRVLQCLCVAALQQRALLHN